MTGFRDQVQAYARTGGYLGRAQEQALIRLGVAGYGLDFDEARGAVLDAAAAGRLVRESAVDDTVADYLSSRAGPSGRVSRGMFDSAVDLYRSQSRDLLSRADASIRVKEAMIRHGFVAAPSGLFLRTRGWFERIPRLAPEVALPGSPPMPTVSVPAPVQATLDAWGAAFSARDVAGVLALYAPDALLLATANPQPVHGRAAMQSYFENLLINRAATVQFGATLHVDGVDPAAASGLYTFTWNDPAGGRSAAPARYTFVVTRNGAGPTGFIRQHHSSALPRGPSDGCPV